MPRSRSSLARAALLLAVLFVVAPVTAAETFPEAIRRYDTLAVDASSRDAKGMVLRSGRMVLRVEDGRVAQVRAGTEVVGLFVAGKGTLEYVSTDAVEHPVVNYTAKKNSGLDVTRAEGGLVLTEAFSSALWLASGTPLPALPETADAGSLADDLGKHRERFGNVAQRPVAMDLARARLDAPAQPWVRVEATASGDDLVYLLDGVADRAESLSVASRFQYAAGSGDSRKFVTVLSEQPVGRDRRQPVPSPYLLTDVDLSLTASDGESAALTVTETFQAVAAQPGVLFLDLYSAINRRDNHGNVVPKTVRLKGVFDEAGGPVEHVHRDGHLAIRLREPLARGRGTKLRFEIEGDLLYRPGGDNYWELGTEPWFPQPELNCQFYTVHATVKVKKPFVPLVPGTTVRRVEEGDYNLLETRIAKPVQLFVVIAGKYRFEEETKDGLTIRVASYGGPNRMAYRKLLELSRKMIDYYSGFLGAFPFEEFNIVEINAYGYGQAPPAFMFITTEAFNPIQGEVNQIFSQGINERFAHEIAHQWWGHVVKMPSADEQWISESFAEYSAALLIRDLRGRSDYKGLLAHWRRRANEARDVAPVALATRVRARNDLETSWNLRTALLYSKGPLILEALHRELGDRPFLVFLATLQSNLTWRFGPTGLVQQVLNAVAKKDYGPFLEKYYWGLEMPPAK